MDTEKLIDGGGTLKLQSPQPSQSTAATKNNSANNEGGGNQLSEDVFRMIEHGNSKALETLLSQSAVNLNRSTTGSANDGNQANPKLDDI